jgi:hypothetical protein
VIWWRFEVIETGFVQGGNGAVFVIDLTEDYIKLRMSVVFAVMALFSQFECACEVGKISGSIEPAMGCREERSMERGSNYGVSTKISFFSIVALCGALFYLPQARAARIEVIKDRFEMETHSRIYYQVNGYRADLIAEDQDRYSGSLYDMPASPGGWGQQFQLGSWTEYYYTDPMFHDGVEYRFPDTPAGSVPGPSRLGADGNSRTTITLGPDDTDPTIYMTFDQGLYGYNQDPYLEAVNGYYDWWAEGTIELEWTFRVIGEGAWLEIGSQLARFMPYVDYEVVLHDWGGGSPVWLGGDNFGLEDSHLYTLSIYTYVGTAGDPDPDGTVDLYFRNAELAYVAEPSTISLMLLGMTGMIASRRRVMSGVKSLVGCKEE